MIINFVNILLQLTQLELELLVAGITNEGGQLCFDLMVHY